MSTTKTQKKYAIATIILVVLSIGFMIANFLAFDKFLTHPILNALSVLAIGLTVMSFIIAINKKSPVYFMTGGILLGLVVLYVLLATMLKDWWIAVVCTLAIWLIVALLSYIFVGNKTEEIALNKSPDYKNYQERQAEKEAEEAKEEEKELPTLKSFKE